MWGYGWVIVRGAVALLAVLVTIGGPRALRAQQTSTGDWELTGLTETVFWLHISSSGTMLATSGTIPEPTAPSQVVVARPQLVRSDDGGEHWRPFDLPPGVGLRAIDPTDDAILYASSEQGVHKSNDAGATWELIRPDRFSRSSSDYERRPLQMAVSPADPRLIYLVAKSSPSSFELLRSRDGGTTWEEPLSASGPSPGYLSDVQALLVHGTDPARLMLAVASYHSRLGQVSQALRQSADQGQTWSEDTRPRGPMAGISRLVGWQGTMPARLYLVTTRRELYRSDDDGWTWTSVLTLADEGAAAPGRSIGALAYDPSRPDDVYIAIRGGVRVSADGGVNWAELSRQDLPPIGSLALGDHGRYLYAATEQGLYRLPLRAGCREALAQVPCAR